MLEVSFGRGDDKKKYLVIFTKFHFGPFFICWWFLADFQPQHFGFLMFFTIIEFSESSINIPG